METYREYPIRCKTCNEQLACYAADYEALIEAGSSVEQALNELGITEYCSRIAMMNPTIVAFNMENREVIEGFKSVDAANEADAQNESITRPVFNPCIGSIVQPVPTRLGATAPLLTGLNLKPKEIEQKRVPANIVTGIQTITLAQPAQRQQAPIVTNVPALAPVTRPGIPTLQPVTTNVPTLAPVTRPGIPTLQPVTTTRPLIQPLAPVQLPTQDQEKEQTSAPLIPGIDWGRDIEELGAGITVNIPETAQTDKFVEPVAVGVPTINPDPTVQLPSIYVGAGKYVRILNGRTYLAQ